MNRFISITLIASAALALCACEEIPASEPLVDGVAAAAPAGWVGYCQRHQEDSGCRS